MSSYTKSKIYKITNSVDDKIYVSSTTHDLSGLLAEHIIDAKNHPNRHVNYHFNAIGWDKAEIRLIESIEAKDIMEVVLREQFWVFKLAAELNMHREI